MKNDLFDKLSSGIDKTKNGGASFIKEFLNYILFGLLCVVMIVASAFVPLLTGRELDAAFWVSLCILIIVGVVSMVIFIIQGKDSETRNNLEYKANKKKLEHFSNIVQSGYCLEFKKYCKEQTEQKRRSVFLYYLRRANISEEYFNEKYAKMTIGTLQKYAETLDENGYRNIEKEELKWILKAKEPILVKKISDVEILYARESHKGFEVGVRKKDTSTMLALFGKTLLIIGGSVLAASLTFQVSDRGWVVVVDIILRLAKIVSASVLGFYEGGRQVKKDNGRIKECIAFLRDFAEHKGIELLDEIETAKRTLTENGYKLEG